MSFTIKVEWMGVHLVNTSNKREHFMARAGRTAKQRGGDKMGIAGRLANAIHRRLGKPFPPFTVKIIRLGPKPLDEPDNLNTACKAIRDGVAEILGYDDGRTDIYTWICRQQRSQRYGVIVEVVYGNSDAGTDPGSQGARQGSQSPPGDGYTSPY